MVKIDVDGLVEVRRFVDGLACCFDFSVIHPGVVGENVFQDLPRVDVVVLEGGIAEVYINSSGQAVVMRLRT